MSNLSGAGSGLHLAQGWKTKGLQVVTQQVTNFSALVGDERFNHVYK